MISGTVNQRGEMVIPLEVLDAALVPHQFLFVVDTGFTGTVTLPAATIASLGLTWINNTPMGLADGSTVWFAVYEATVIWDGTPRDSVVRAVAGAPLVGMYLLQGYDLRARLEPGGAVEIELIP